MAERRMSVSANLNLQILWLRYLPRAALPPQPCAFVLGTELELESTGGQTLCSHRGWEPRSMPRLGGLGWPLPTRGAEMGLAQEAAKVKSRPSGNARHLGR